MLKKIGLASKIAPVMFLFMIGCGPQMAHDDAVLGQEAALDDSASESGELAMAQDAEAEDEYFPVEGRDFEYEEDDSDSADSVTAAKTSKKKKKKKKYSQDQAARYESMIAEQFVKGDRFARKNAAMLALNTRQYVWPAGRSKTDPHDRYIVSRAYHDHMKFYQKGYAPNKANYMGIK